MGDPERSNRLSYLGSNVGAMAAEKYSASMDNVLLADARADAEAEGLTLSSWLADAAADRLRLKALRQLVNKWEAEHGAISVAELEALEDKVAKAHRSATERRREVRTEAGRAAAS
jgi:ABC-type glycerol-3-phosphate transport system substrate-binding protein